MEDLTNPWLVAAWPGMGGVGVIAIRHMVEVLEAEKVDTRIGAASHDFDHVHVKDGVMQPLRPVETSMWIWRDPRGLRDLVIVTSDAQPQQAAMWSYCLSVAKEARRLRVGRIITFAASATSTSPDEPSVVSAAVSPDDSLLGELRKAGIGPLGDDVQVSGVNGLAVAAGGAAGVPGACLLATMPYFAAQVPNPKASLAALEAFCSLSGVDFSLEMLREHAEHMAPTISHLRAHVEGVRQDAHAAAAAEEEDDEEEDEGPAPHDKVRIERLFAEAKGDREAAIRLKAELDRLGAFKDYENRFLDLFRGGA